MLTEQAQQMLGDGAADGVDAQARTVSELGGIDTVQVQRRHPRLVLTQIAFHQHGQKMLAARPIALDQQTQAGLER